MCDIDECTGAGARGLVHTTEGDQQLVPLIVRTSLSILRHKRAMGSRSHLVGKGAMREHLAYQASVRRSAAAGAGVESQHT